MKKIYITAGLCLCLAVGGFYVFQETVRAQSGATAAPELSEQEKAEYAKLASRDPKAKEAFEDMKVIASLAASGSQLLMKEVTIAGEQFQLRALAMPLIYAFYNVAEIGLAVIKFRDEQETALLLNGKCAFEFNDEALRAATARGRKDPVNLANFTIEQCADNGCPNKRICVANLLEKSIKAIRPIYDNAVAKYERKADGTGTAQAGLLLNAAQAFENVIDILLKLPAVKGELASKGWDGRAAEFRAQVTKLRSLVGVGAAVFSNMLEVLQLLVLAIGGKEMLQYLPPELKEAGEQIIKEGTTIIIDDAAIDNMVDDLGLDDFNLDDF